MTNFKVLSKTIFLNISVPVQVGPIRLNNIYQVSVYKSKEIGKILYDIDDVDYQNVTYWEMKVDGYNGFDKLRKFHKELGIDIDSEIRKEASEKFDPQELEKWIMDNYKDSFEELK
jgi:hypothetical protein